MNLENWKAGELDPTFFGRKQEMEWLLERFRRRSFGVPIVICGPPGVGKTALLKQFLSSAQLQQPPLALTTHFRPDETLAEIYKRTDKFYKDQNPPEIVAIDDADTFDERQLNIITSRVLNFKAVRALIFVTRRHPDFSRADILQLKPLSMVDAQNILRNLLGNDFPSVEIHRAASVAAGSPLALGQIAELVSGRDLFKVDKLLRGQIYDLNEQFILPELKLITEVKPKIMLASNSLVERLQQHPDAIYEISPRKFEELVADLLTDLGYEVELTPTTHDGGMDILARMTTHHGKILCLVEAKRHSAHRPVGVELVRQLYGTLIDADASSAMMVTTSNFTSGAKVFQQRHKYKLALKDYANVVQWINGFTGKNEHSFR